MGWKQPIDTDIYDWFGDDHLARDLFIHLLLKAQNSDMTSPKRYKNKPFILMRGEVIFGREQYKQRLRCSGTGLYKALQRLKKVFGKVTTKPSSDYTIITILNYDKLVDTKQAKSQARVKRESSERHSL